MKIEVLRAYQIAPLYLRGLITFQIHKKITHTFRLYALLKPEAKKPPNGPRVAANMDMNNP